MRIARTLTACLGVAFLLTLAASSARADSICADDMVVKVHNTEGHLFNLPDQSRAGMVHLFAEDFETNNGKHLGFSVASLNRGNKFGLFKGPQGSSGGGETIPNPEPAAVFLLGSGLAGLGAYARRRFRKSTH